MENQIKKCLLSLRKIANITADCQIDPSNHEIDIHVNGIINDTCRAVKGVFIDIRAAIIVVLECKYADTKEHIKYIMESGKHTDQLATIRARLEDSKNGLVMFGRNERYKTDMKMSPSIAHLLEDEIPSITKKIDLYFSEHPEINKTITVVEPDPFEQKSSI